MATEAQQKYWDSMKGMVSPTKGKKFPYKARPKAVGREVWNKGKKMSDESCQKMSESRKKAIENGTVKSWNKGKKMSAEAVEKNRQAQTGKKLSIETRKKISESHKGEKAYQWKGGITKENLIIRGSLEVRLWREACFERDSFTCQKCLDDTGGNLNAHHIQNFSAVPELRTSIENGITFCKPCHQSFHNKYGYTKNNKEQLEEFLTNTI